jgi:hypothetical protein
LQQRDVLACGREDFRRRTGEQRLQREPAARVLQVASHQSRAAFRAMPQWPFRHSCTLPFLWR